MNRQVVRYLLATALFIFGIILSYQGLGIGKPWLGADFILAVTVLYLIQSRERKKDFEHLIKLSVIAFVMETLLVATNVYKPTMEMRFLLPAPLCPIWVFALWVNLIIRLKAYKDNFKQRHTGPFIVAFVFGLIVFHHLEQDNIVEFGYDFSLYICSTVWGITGVIAFYITNKMFTKK